MPGSITRCWGCSFLDLGLSLEQYALLNVIWAFSIVILEVPSGALADQIGRKRMVVLAGILMVLEMGLFAFAPAPESPLLFWVLAANRLLSGAAEACASGADEALAYDSLAAAGRRDEWLWVMERLMRWQSAAFFVVMIVGAAVYDREWLARLLGGVGLSWPLGAGITVRIPLYLTLATAIMTLLCALGMREPAPASGARRVTVRSTLRQTLSAGRWILTHPFALALILTGLVFDSMIRLVLTLNSNYYRLLALPEAVFGLLGAAMALVGLATAPIARRLATAQGAVQNFALLAVLTLAGLGAMAWFRSPLAVLVLVPIGFAMQASGLFLSTYLNAAVDSHHRATVLSFRGLAYNIGYGLLGLGYALLSQALRRQAGGVTLSAEQVLAKTLVWFPLWFALTLVLLTLFLLARRTEVRGLRSAV